ncbi:MAG: 16S rRNA (guanine(527)-N(7))-methyltransferase RsmG [Bacteroidales bacterium]|nr:16S rRNA (guanine(527)-N(7))-methyltransferase RsmG [Bacteroidales bacterium]
MSHSINHYFEHLSTRQYNQINALQGLYEYWNQQINVVSRKDMENLFERHILHSLGIAKVIQFKSGTHILDVGTGGGFPGIPLSILFPDAEFLLVDSIGKKIKVVEAVKTELGLKNVMALNSRVEIIPQKFHFIVSRAVTTLPEFLPWVGNKILSSNFNNLPNGVLYLKGGDISEEIAQIKAKVTLFPLSEYFEEPFFETKQVVHIKLKA